MDRCAIISTIFLVLGMNLIFDVALGYDQDLVKKALLSFVSLVAFFAFLSAYLQLPGILGNKGLLPVSQTLDSICEYVFVKREAKLPVQDRIMPFMLSLVYEKYHTTGDYTKHVERNGQVDLALSVLSLVYPHPLLFVYLYVSYYSIKRVGGRFFNFQWDALLLETLALTILLSMSFDSITTKLTIWLFKILLFRLMFGSGVVKYCSGDPSWSKDFTAMGYHFLTQPLPNTLGMRLYSALPPVVFRCMTVGTLVVEGLVPLLPLTGLTVLCRATAALYILLQIAISTTGYYGFFNYLTMALSLSLLDDALFVAAARAVLGEARLDFYLDLLAAHGSLSGPPVAKVPVLSLLGLLGRALSACLLYPAVTALFCSNLVALYLLVQRMDGVKIPAEGVDASDDNDDGEEEWVSVPGAHQQWHRRLHRAIRVVLRHLEAGHALLLSTLFIGNHYGLFATMTKIRNELIVEVSCDSGRHWHAIELAAKPGDPNRPPKTVWPFFHMPRVDWVFWFLAFRPVKELLPKWFWTLLVAVMQGDNPHVLDLLDPTANAELFARAAETRDRAIAAAVPTGDAMEGDPAPPLFPLVRVQLMNYTFTEHQRRTKGPPPRPPTAAAPGDKDPAIPDLVSGDEESEDSSSSNSPRSTLLGSVPGPPPAARPAAPAPERQDGRYWSVLPLRTVLPPTTLADVYAILDGFDARIQQRVAERSPPTAETAKDVIMRTLFANLERNKTRKMTAKKAT